RRAADPLGVRPRQRGNVVAIWRTPAGAQRTKILSGKELSMLRSAHRGDHASEADEQMMKRLVKIGLLRDRIVRAHDEPATALRLLLSSRARLVHGRGR